ncbi:MAG: cytochrome b N-terminal domain-containing protein [Acidobacteria bacterium]|nr:cytochrome b N-terminal domain-containing protein [Acidobacteriota bacterium]
MQASLSQEPKKRLAAVYDWADERLGLTGIIDLARHKTVPDHKYSFWYYWGGISLFFFIVQVFSGILLLVYYRAGADAYESVRQITYDIKFGWLVRSAHSWSANLMVLAVFVHLFSVLFMKAYRKPREFGWWSGLILLGLTMVFGFSGYLLPMDDLAYFATKVGLEIPASIPLVGDLITNIVRGGQDVSEVTIQRFFALHVVILPLMYIPFLGFHLFLVQKHGNALPPSEEAKPMSERRFIRFFPDFFAKDMGMWLIALNILAILASLYPWQLGKQADPLASAPEGIHPEWYFMSQFQILKVFGRWFPGAAGEALGMLLFTAALVVLVLIPFLDPGSKSGRRARTVTYIGLGLLLGLIFTTIWGYWEV